MTDPEQVLVNVADLRALVRLVNHMWIGTGQKPSAAFSVPDPEWEPTDDMRRQQERVFNYLDVDWTDDMVDRALWAMHREGLL